MPTLPIHYFVSSLGVTLPGSNVSGASRFVASHLSNGPAYVNFSGTVLGEPETDRKLDGEVTFTTERVTPGLGESVSLFGTVTYPDEWHGVDFFLDTGDGPSEREDWVTHIASPYPRSLEWQEVDGQHSFYIVGMASPLGTTSKPNFIPEWTINLRYYLNGREKIKAQVQPEIVASGPQITLYYPFRIRMDFSADEIQAMKESGANYSIRIVDSYGQDSDWVPVQFAPQPIVTFKNWGEFVDFESSQTYSIDGRTTSKRFVIGTTDVTYVGKELTLGDNNLLRFDWDSPSLAQATRTNPYVSLEPGFTITWDFRVASENGWSNSYSLVHSQLLETVIATQWRSLCRPDQRIITRPKQILWQHHGQNRIWSGVTWGGQISYSEDEGENWAFPFIRIYFKGAYSLGNPFNPTGRTVDFVAAPHGGIASIGKQYDDAGVMQLLFCIAPDGQNFEAPVTIGPVPEAGGSFRIISLEPSGTNGYIVTDLQTKKWQSYDDGATWEEIGL